VVDEFVVGAVEAAPHFVAPARGASMIRKRGCRLAEKHHAQKNTLKRNGNRITFQRD
jgi:hypothetical protein